jgi:hypothetical protein
MTEPLVAVTPDRAGVVRVGLAARSLSRLDADGIRATARSVEIVASL